MSEAPLLELREVSKTFGGVHAVADANLALHSGEVLGLVGHNGAGKSTLVKLISGALRADAGEIRVKGESARIRSPRDARRYGIETLYQNLALAENLDATANVFLGREQLTRLGTLDHRAMERRAREVIRRLNPQLEALRVPVQQLSGGQRQTVAIARAVLFQARVLLMDEPTASLGPQETALVAELVQRLKAEGLGLVLVSHDLHDVFELSDRIAVMRGGRLVADVLTRSVTREDVVRLIVG